MLSNDDGYAAPEIIPPTAGLFNHKVLLDYARRVYAEVMKLKVENYKLNQKINRLESGIDSHQESLLQNRKIIASLEERYNEIQNKYNVERDLHDNLKIRFKEITHEASEKIHALEKLHNKKTMLLKGLIKKHNRAWNRLWRRFYIGSAVVGAIIAICFGVFLSSGISTILVAVKHFFGG